MAGRHSTLLGSVGGAVVPPHHLEPGICGGPVLEGPCGITLFRLREGLFEPSPPAVKPHGEGVLAGALDPTGDWDQTRAPGRGPEAKRMS